MKLGVNNDVNTSTKEASLRPMDGGPSEINPPNSHPSNHIHKKAMGEKNNKKASVTPAPTQTEAPAPTQEEAPASTQTDTEIEPHHINKAIIAVGAVGLAGLIVWMRERLTAF